MNGLRANINGLPPPRRQRLRSIQAARGVAALMVVAFHASLSLGKPQYLGHAPLRGVFSFGHAGVDFFFVLSGFTIAYVHASDIGQPRRLGHYVWRRVSRIYPVYWVITAGVIARDLLTSNTDALNLPVLLESWSLVPTDHVPLIPPAWTLEHELLFYAAFGSAIRWRRAVEYLATGALVLIIMGLFMPSAPWPFAFLASAYHIQFLLGIGAARVIARYEVHHPLWTALAGTAIFIATAALDVAKIVEPGQPVSIGLYGVGSALVIIGIVAGERSGLLRCGRPAETFGAISYSLYLTNLFVVGVTAIICSRLELLRAIPDWLIIAGQIGASVIAALGIHLLIEKPLMRLVRRVAPRAPARQDPG